MIGFDLTGRTAWVTGAGKGLGRAIARGLAAAGARLVLTSRTRADLEDLAAELGEGTLVLPGSVADAGFADECAERIGHLDVLVHCAGISPTFKRSERVTDEEWQQVLRVNLDGTWFCCRAAGRRMLERGGGSIVTVSSVHGTTGFERIAAYAASKGGVEALTRVLAVEWADRGVRVNALAPGYFATDLSGGLMASRWGEVIRRGVPQGRIGAADELAGAAVFLASDASSYVTGTTLYVDGGWTAH
ncbi:SDR family NAD(P)-dependent oxidoreductase [Amycolatopsis sacchari]|uniref:NAD(P)-dependent dehydrogenase, short-chain alcohol dehydrogenase family n=1 Tax=Amycolatopsis sacchari TaxID=115433 RepID=A0A1I3YB81_9PSEU|nr:SDR family oxidoreductase [Amycolatopsis sacchari]SFK28639.1 NAD(P)-dependent dehydrogenase, short-chain alcohol dehydrogenase family [Amycolatopsis sacchari]